MTDDERSSRAAGKNFGGFLIAVIALNLLLRSVALPHIDLPSVSLPDMPAWAGTLADGLHWVLRIKNWILIAVVLMIAIGLAVDQRNQDRSRSDTEDGAP